MNLIQHWKFQLAQVWCQLGHGFARFLIFASLIPAIDKFKPDQKCAGPTSQESLDFLKGLLFGMCMRLSNNRFGCLWVP